MHAMHALAWICSHVRDGIGAGVQVLQLAHPAQLVRQHRDAVAAQLYAADLAHLEPLGLALARVGQDTPEQRKVTGCRRCIHDLIKIADSCTWDAHICGSTGEGLIRVPQSGRDLLQVFS